MEYKDKIRAIMEICVDCEPHEFKIKDGNLLGHIGESGDENGDEIVLNKSGEIFNVKGDLLHKSRLEYFISTIEVRYCTDFSNISYMNIINVLEGNPLKDRYYGL